MKQILKYSIYASLIFFCSNLFADEGCWLKDKETGKKFRIFNALLYVNAPDFKNICVGRINVLYAWRFFPRGNKHGDLTLPSKKQLHKLIGDLKDNDSLTVIDIEHWPLKNKPQDIIEKSVENYIYLLKNLKGSLPNIKMGYYGVVPTKDFSRAKQNPESKSYKEWMRQNDNVIKIAELVDASFPSLYTINPVHDEWINRAIAHIDESHRIAPRKPVYPFIWPNYHEQGGKYPCCVEVDRNYWRKQLELLRENSDGLVLWGGYKQEWNENSSWWKETILFLRESFDIVDIN